MKYDNYTKHQKAELELLDKKILSVGGLLNQFLELDEDYEHTPEGKLLLAMNSSLHDRHSLYTHMCTAKYKLKLERENDISH